MIEARRFPSALYSDGRILVGSRNEDTLEQLSLSVGQPGPLFLLTPLLGGVSSPCESKGRILLVGELI